MSGPGAGTRDSSQALRSRQLDRAMRDGWHIRYDGAHDEFVASRDEVSAHSLDELLIAVARVQAGKIGDEDDPL